MTTYTRPMGKATITLGSIRNGFATFRLFRPGRADQLMIESIQRQAQALKHLSSLFPTSTPWQGPGRSRTSSPDGDGKEKVRRFIERVADRHVGAVPQQLPFED